MKKSIKGLLNQLTKREVNFLTSIVDETLAMDLIEKEEKVFTAADLWNIHRNIKLRSGRKFL